MEVKVILKPTRQTAGRALAVAANVIITAVFPCCVKAPVRAATAAELNRFDDQESYVADGQTIQVQRMPNALRSILAIGENVSMARLSDGNREAVVMGSTPKM